MPWLGWQEKADDDDAELEFTSDDSDYDDCYVQLKKLRYVITA